jgi:hypothetical protein
MDPDADPDPQHAENCGKYYHIQESAVFLLNNRCLLVFMFLRPVLDLS